MIKVKVVEILVDLSNTVKELSNRQQLISYLGKSIGEQKSKRT